MNVIQTFNKKIANAIVGGLSDPGKMPGFGWSIPAELCKRGSKLRNVKGSTCEKCYAMKGRYTFKSVKNAMYNRLTLFNSKLWIPAMVYLLKDQKYFRWFDSGDLQDLNMLKKIVQVCEQTPNCKHWLPTREFAIIKKFIKNGNVVPKNLTIRISADLIGQYPKHKIENIPFSTISLGYDDFKDYKYPKVYNCPVSFKQDIKTCKQAKCTACWNNKVQHINYKKH